MSKEAAGAVVAVASPSFGPAVLTIFGLDIPIMAFGLSMMALLLARSIAPASRRKLTRNQEIALSVLLVMVLLMVVTGQFTDGEPMAAGMALVWGIGLGTSGLLCIEFFGSWVVDMLRRILYGINNPPPADGEQK